MGNNEPSQEINTSSDPASPKGSDAVSVETEDLKGCDSGQTPGTPESGSSEPTVEQLQAALATEKDRILRISAEFDNYKKRSSREMAEFRKFANETVLKQLLTVVDNLERAISSASQNNTSTEVQEDHVGDRQNPEVQDSCIIQGVEMTHKDIIKLFETFNVKPVESLGKPFDPVFHQAVSHQESDAHPDNTVIAELQKGYLLHDRLLRPSMVVVSKAVSKNEAVSNNE
ncbi:MAG: nucleotide exchange factor GrpE [Desulfamplus sp.]|nr:nucleotide exchange factor GrpE [Desulfamplus sp.]